MTPILLKADAKTKIGWLSECTACEVTEERNGVYELELVYPIGAAHANDIVTDCYIKAKPNQTSANQLFHIYKVSKPINGEFTVYAEHVSYILSGYPVPTVSVSGNAQVAINAILTAAKNQLGKATGFTAATTDISLSSSINLSNVSARAALGGVEGSVLYTYGGEYEFDNYTIKLHKSRGKDNGVRIAYGKNMTELKCDVDMSASYTGIFGYVKTDDVNLTSSYNVTNTSGISTRILVRDFSSDFGGNAPTQSSLDAAVKKYAEDNDINSIKASVTVSFVNLAQSPEYANIAPLEAVNLCDTVTIYHKELGVNIKAKVIKTVYDTIAEKYTKIELGSARTNMSSIISQTVKEAADAKNIAISSKSEVTEAYQEAIANATAAITGNSGGYIRLNPSENPQELLIMNTADASTATKIWRWNLSGLGYSSTGYSGTYKTAITQDGHIVADFIDTGTLTANIIKAGIMQSANGEFSFNLESGHIEASDINITGGNINLDGGTLSVLNNDGYKADLSGGVLDLYQGAGTETVTGEKYLTFGSSMLLTTAISGNWYATIAAPEFTLGERSSKGFRFGTSTLNASAAKPAVGGLAYNWDTDFAIIEKDRTRIRQCVETNEAKEDQFESLIHHRTVGGTNFKLGIGIAKMNANKTPGAGFEIRGETSGTLWAGLYAWTEADNIMRLTFRTSNQDGTTYSRTLTANGDFLYFNGRRLKFADEKT
jgi:phage minor structural protein